jgi:hypothetical protein
MYNTVIDDITTKLIGDLTSESKERNDENLPYDYFIKKCIVKFSKNKY